MTPVRIAVTGHTNVGKTTLIRTLTKSNYGVVADKANVTEIPEETEKPQDRETLYATFTDCPGFTEASQAIKYLKLIEQKAPEDKIKEYFEEQDLIDMRFDVAAYQGIEGSDIAIYVVDLDFLPQTQHNHEVAIVRLKQQNIIGIINKSKKSTDEKENKKNQQRIALWEKFFRDNNIKYFVKFDAFWDQPSKINEIYQFIAIFLKESNDTNKYDLFRERLQKFRISQNEITQTAADYLSDCIIACRDYKGVFAKQEGYNEAKVREEAVKQITKYFDEFVIKVTQLYKFRQDNPSTPLSPTELRELAFTNKDDVMNGAKTGAKIGGAVGAGLGILVGGVVAAASAAITLGAAIPFALSLGITLVSGGGAVVGIVSNLDNCFAISLTQENLKNIAIFGLADLWELHCHGFGNKLEDQGIPKLEQDDIEKLFSEIEQYYMSKKIDFSNKNKAQISEWCVKFLQAQDDWKVEG